MGKHRAVLHGLIFVDAKNMLTAAWQKVFKFLQGGLTFSESIKQSCCSLSKLQLWAGWSESVCSLTLRGVYIAVRKI